MRVMLVCYDYSRCGGCERVAHNLYKELSSKLDIYIVSLYKSKEVCSLDDEFVKYLLCRNGSFLKDAISLFRQLVRLIKLFSVDIIVSVGVNASFYVTIASRLLGLKSVICEHSNISNNLYNTRKQMIKRGLVIPLCTRFVTLTESDKDEYEKRYPRYKSKFTSIYNWIDINSEQINHHYNILSHKIITICRIDRVKSIERSITIFKKIQKYASDWTWEIYGEGDEQYLNELTTMVDKEGLSNFYFRGFIKEPNNVYKEAAIYACTSLYEGLPVSLLEAKSWHIPIISFDCKTGPSEIIMNNINGYLIDEGNVDEFACLLKKLIIDDYLRMEFSRHSYENIEKFSKDHITNKWVELFRVVINNECN